MPVLVVTEPESFVTVVVGEIIDTLAVLLVLEPFSFILLTVEEGIGTEALTLAFHVFTLVDIAVLISGLSFSMGFSLHHLSLILATVFGVGRAEGYLLCIRRKRRQK